MNPVISQIKVDNVTYDIVSPIEQNNVEALNHRSRYSWTASEFIHGSVQDWSDGLINTSITHRICFPRSRKFSYNLALHTDNYNYRFFVSTYNADGTVSGSGYKYQYTVPADTDFNITILRRTEDNTEIVDIAEFASHVKIENIITNIAENSAQVAELNPADFISGDAQFWLPGSNLSESIKYRVANYVELFYQFDKPIYIATLDAEFRFALGFFDEQGNVTDLGWNTYYCVPANQKFRMMIARTSENTSEIADVTEFTSKVAMYTQAFQAIREDIQDIREDMASNQNETDSLFRSVIPKPFEMISINHRGYNNVSLGGAPENTLKAFKISKQKGFDFVETDVRFTSDGIPVLLHDQSINRTARNADGSTISEAIAINNITYAQALTYDFGIWKGEQFAGTKIPTLAEFLNLCKALSLHAYLDLYGSYTDARATTIKNLINSYGMQNNVSLIGSSYSTLRSMAKFMPYMRFGLVSWDNDPYTGPLGVVTYVDMLRDHFGVKNMFVDIDVSYADINKYRQLCEEKNLGLEVYCPNTVEAILNLDTFVTGVTSDSLIAKNVLLEENLY